MVPWYLCSSLIPLCIACRWLSCRGAPSRAFPVFFIVFVKLNNFSRFLLFSFPRARCFRYTTTGPTLSRAAFFLFLFFFAQFYPTGATSRAALPHAGARRPPEGSGHRDLRALPAVRQRPRQDPRYRTGASTPERKLFFPFALGWLSLSVTCGMMTRTVLPKVAVATAAGAVS